MADVTIPLARPWITEREHELVREVLDSGILSLGPMLRRFEEAFAEWNGTRHAVACSSGTTGLHLACITSGFGPGDEVVTSPFSFVASANAIRYTGATVVFADVDPDTLNLDPARVEEAVTERTRGLLPVHIFGYPADMDPLMDTARRHELAVVEDACEAIGASYRGRRIGTFGNPAMYGFYPNKQMATGEGGILVTDDDDLAAQWHSLLNQGRSDSGEWLEHARLGYNYRMSDVAAAIGLAQLERIDEILERRAAAAARYDRLLAGIDGIRLPYRGEHERSWFVYWVQVEDGIDRNAVMAALGERGIQSKPYLPSIHLQPAYRELGFGEGMFPNAERLSRQCLAIPFHTMIEEADQQRVAESLAEVLAAAAVPAG